METGLTTKELQTFCDKAESKAASLKSYSHTPWHLFLTWFALGTHLVFWVLLTIIVQSRKKAGKD